MRAHPAATARLGRGAGTVVLNQAEETRPPRPGPYWLRQPEPLGESGDGSIPNRTAGGDRVGQRFVRGAGRSRPPAGSGRADRRFGGATPAGFDSSGFTHYVYAQHGIELPRVAAQQYRVGTPAARHDLRPGDLVFFDTASRSNPSHVGLVVGDGRFLYASVALGEVHADRLDTSFWRQRYLGARRIVASRDGRVARHIDRSGAWRRGKTGVSLRRLR